MASHSVDMANRRDWKVIQYLLPIGLTLLLLLPVTLKWCRSGRILEWPEAVFFGKIVQVRDKNLSFQICDPSSYIEVTSKSYSFADQL